MKITKKMKQEIDFICTFFCEPKGHVPTVSEINNYIESTVLGTKKDSGGGIKGETSILFQGKRNLDMTIKMWREDLLAGMLSLSELEEDYNGYPYGRKLLLSIKKGIDFNQYKKGKGFPDIVAMNILYGKEIFKQE